MLHKDQYEVVMAELADSDDEKTDLDDEATDLENDDCEQTASSKRKPPKNRHEFYQQNREYYLEYQKKYREKNAEAIRTQQEKQFRQTFKVVKSAWNKGQRLDFVEGIHDPSDYKFVKYNAYVGKATQHKPFLIVATKDKDGTLIAKADAFGAWTKFIEGKDDPGTLTIEVTKRKWWNNKFRSNKRKSESIGNVSVIGPIEVLAEKNSNGELQAKRDTQGLLQKAPKKRDANTLVVAFPYAEYEKSVRKRRDLKKKERTLGELNKPVGSTETNTSDMQTSVSAHSAASEITSTETTTQKSRQAPWSGFFPSRDLVQNMQQNQIQQKQLEFEQLQRSAAEQKKTLTTIVLAIESKKAQFESQPGKLAQVIKELKIEEKKAALDQTQLALTKCADELNLLYAQSNIEQDSARLQTNRLS